MSVRPSGPRVSSRGMRRAGVCRPCVLACVAAMVALSASSASSAPTPVAATVAAAKPVVLVSPGDVAHVAITLTTAGGQALDRAVTVDYQTGATLTVGSGAAARSLPSSATAGTDYTPGLGQRHLPGRAVSGTSLSFDVHTLAASAPSEAKTINIALSTTDTATDAASALRASSSTLTACPTSTPACRSPSASRPALADVAGREDRPDDPGRPVHVHRRRDDQQASANDLRAWLLDRCCPAAATRPTPNTPAGWADMVDGFQSQALATPLQIPLIYGEDTVHGDGNMIGATVFPHNIGIGATRDPALALAEGQVAAAETRATGPSGALPRACAWLAISAGGAPTSPSARTRRSSRGWRPRSTGSRAPRRRPAPAANRR